MQQEEFEVLESIYPEYISMQNSEGHIKLEIPVEFEMPRPVIIIEEMSLMDKISPQETLNLSST